MENLNKKIICTDKDKKEYEITADQLSFRPSVYGVIVDNGKVLLARQWDGYDFPGGGINLGETIEEALIREVKEETGFDVKPLNLIGCEADFHKMTFNQNFAHCILIYYQCKIIGGKLSKDNLDAASHENEYMDIAQWIDFQEVSKIKFYKPINIQKLLSPFKNDL